MFIMKKDYWLLQLLIFFFFFSYEVLAAGSIPKGFMDGKQASTLMVSLAKYIFLYWNFILTYLTLMTTSLYFLTIRSNI